MKCSILGCKNLVYKRRPSKGWCQKHYNYDCRYGNPLHITKTELRRESMKAFIEYAINFNKKRPHLIWPYSRQSKGYAVRGKELIHRIVCEAVNGKPPPDKPFALHDDGNGHGCGHLGCINPWHLYWGDYNDNKYDQIVHGTQPTGESHGRHILTEDGVKEIRKLYTVESWTLKKLANKFDVSIGTIWRVANNKHWKYL